MTQPIQATPVHATVFPQGMQGRGPVIGGLKDDSARMKIYPEQKVYLLLDNSGSVSGEPAEEINQAVKNMMAVMAAPENKDGFRISVISFGSNATLLCDDKLPQGIVANVDGNGGGTELMPALEIVESQEVSFAPRPNRVKSNSMSIVLTDGGFGDTDQATQKISDLKRLGMQVMTIGVGDGCDESVLRSMATSSDYYAKTNGSGLMSLLTQVGKTMSRKLVQ